MDDKWYDVFIDPIIDYYEPKGYQWTIIETAQRGLFKSPLYRPTKSISLSLIYNYLKSIFLIRRVPSNKDFDKNYKTFSKIMEQNGLSGYVDRVQNLYLEASYISLLSKFFQKYLKRLRPKIVFMAPYNGYAGRALCHACSKMSITTVDVQHGIQGRFHHAYSYRKVPRVGFNVLPNIYLTWSDTESSSLNKSFEKVSNSYAITIGNMMLNKFIYNSEMNTYYRGKLESAFPKKEGVRYILITLQWGYAFPSIFQNLIKTSPKNYFYLIRLHPSSTPQEKKQIMNTLASVGLNNYDTHYSNTYPVYSLLNYVFLHITKYSSVVLEAIQFNVKSIIIDSIGKDLFANEIKEGKVYWCNNKNKIINRIRSLEQTKVRKKEVPFRQFEYHELDNILNISGK